MAMKPPSKKVYRTMQGKIVDLDRLIKRNELTPAVGNARVNARGDELGPGGKIVRKREEVVQEYYEGSKPVAEEVAVRETQVSEAEAAELAEFDDEPNPPKVIPKKLETVTAPAPVKQQPTLGAKPPQKPSKAEWSEDADGNFTKG